MDSIRFKQLTEEILDTRTRIQEGKDAVAAMRQAHVQAVKRCSINQDADILEVKRKYAAELQQMNDTFNKQLKQQQDINRTLSMSLFRLEAEMKLMQQDDTANSMEE